MTEGKVPEPEPESLLSTTASHVAAALMFRDKPLPNVTWADTNFSWLSGFKFGVTGFCSSPRCGYIVRYCRFVVSEGEL
jgi:hypothetical protein